MVPYYQDELATLYHGDCREIDAWDLAGAFMVTDPPYGIDYQSGKFGFVPRSIVGDKDTTLRDDILERWGSRPALVFGTWRVQRPAGTRMLLVWDTKGALGMGDLSLPWKPSHQEIYVLGTGFSGERTTDVLVCAPLRSTTQASNARSHPHQKPVPLLGELIGKCSPLAEIVDPFAGVGSTLVAAKQLGRKAVGVEIDEGYCEMAARRLSQGVLFEEAV